MREVKVTNFNTGKTMEFFLDGGIEGIGNIRTHGEGIFGETRSDIKGEYVLSALNIARVLKNYEGFVDSRGSFTYKDEKLVMDGDAEAPYFSMMEKFLLKRLPTENEHCRLHATWADGIADVSLEGLSFKGTPLSLKFKAGIKNLLYLALVTDYIRIPDLFEYVDFAALTDRAWEPFSYLKDGKVRVESFVFTKGKPLTGRVDLRGASGGKDAIFLSNVEGGLRLDGHSLFLSDLKGRFNEGRFYAMSGVVPLKTDREVRITGKYKLALKDLNRFNEAKEVEALAGTAEGSLRLSGREGAGFKVETSGFVRDGQFLWKGVPFRASTDYAYANGAVAFDRLLIRSEGTSLALRGKAERHRAAVTVEGVLDARYITRLFLPRQPLEGPVGLDGNVEIRDGSYSAKGCVDMTGLSFEIPGVMKKGPGVESLAFLSARGRSGGKVFLDNLNLTLGGMKARISGEAGSGSISNLHLIVDAPRIEELSKLFFF